MKTLSGRYRLRYPVGRGGMAVVWRADDMVLKRAVAVKLLHSHLPETAWVSRRILAEAIAAGRLNHPNIARVYDYGVEVAADGSRMPYLVLEFVDGPSLAAVLADRPMPWPRAAAVCASVADALATAHAHGLVHRDVKAGNILHGDDGVKMIDFGVAAEVGDDLADPSGHVWGTPGCLPPEAGKDRTAAPAADVFALGLLMVHCLTGERPERTPRRRIDPEAVCQHLPDSPSALRDLIRACLRPAPDRRPSAAAVAARLHALVPPTPDTKPEPSAHPTRRLPRRAPYRWGRVTGAAAAGLVVAAATALVVSLIPDGSAGAMRSADGHTAEPSCAGPASSPGMPASPCGSGTSSAHDPAPAGTITPRSSRRPPIDHKVTESAVHSTKSRTGSRPNRSTPAPAHTRTSPPVVASKTPVTTTQPTVSASATPTGPSATPSARPTTDAPTSSSPTPAASSSVVATPRRGTVSPSAPQPSRSAQPS